MGQLEFRPGVVSAWGRTARQSGGDVRSAKRKVAAAEQDAACVFAPDLATRRASDRFTELTETHVGNVAEALAGTGDKLATTASLVRTTDNESTNLFRSWSGRHGARP